MHSKHDNMHKNAIFYALICINNQIISCVNFMLSTGHLKDLEIMDLLSLSLSPSL